MKNELNYIDICYFKMIFRIYAYYSGHEMCRKCQIADIWGP